LCQELILQWSKRVYELERLGIKLVLVSIGTPDKGKKLVDHLEFEGGEDYLYVDPDNLLYDATGANRGVGRTFFNINTPFSFLDRIQKPDGLKELTETVLPKWNKGKSRDFCSYKVL